MAKRAANMDRSRSTAGTGSGTIEPETPETAGFSLPERSVATGKSHSEFSKEKSRDPIELMLGQAQSRVPELVPVRHGRGNGFATKDQRAVAVGTAATYRTAMREFAAMPFGR